MADLIAIGYSDEETAAKAAAEAQRLAANLVIEPDAIAVIRRDREGKFHVTTNHRPVSTGAIWGMFWGILFGVLFFVPVLGMAVGAGLGALMGIVSKSDMDAESKLGSVTCWSLGRLHSSWWSRRSHPTRQSRR
jgi:uncharacterized membrane protein